MTPLWVALKQWGLRPSTVNPQANTVVEQLEEQPWARVLVNAYMPAAIHSQRQPLRVAPRSFDSLPWLLVPLRDSNAH